MRRVTCGIDENRFCPGPRPSAAELGIPKTDLYVLCVCQIRPEKRVELLLDIAAEVFRRRPELSLTFLHAGDGPLRKACEEKARRLGLQDRYVFLGKRQEDLIDFYRRADINLHAASREAISLATAEAMACELPVITSRVGGQSELVVHEETGFLIDPDPLDGYVAALLRLADSPEERARMGRNGRQRVLAGFRMDREADDLRAILLEQVRLATGK
jgi:glycosyltransferase involved in cell wall biosynthesis